MSWAFPGPGPGLLKEPSYVCIGVPEQAQGRRWIRRRGPGGPHLFALTWGHTGRGRGHRRPQPLRRCVCPLRSCSRRQSLRGTGAAASSHPARMHWSTWAFEGPGALCGSALPGFPQGPKGPCSFASCGLGQPPSIAGLRQSLRSTVPLDGEQDVRRAPGALLPQLAGGGFASPGPPSQSSEPASGLFLHWGFSRA